MARERDIINSSLWFNIFCIVVSFAVVAGDHGFRGVLDSVVLVFCWSWCGANVALRLMGMVGVVRSPEARTMGPDTPSLPFEAPTWRSDSADSDHKSGVG
jgi:hypothetical protein